MVYADYDVNVLVSLIAMNKTREENLPQMEEKVLSLTDSETLVDRNKVYNITVEESLFSKEGKDILLSQDKGLLLQVHSMDSSSFNSLKEELHLTDTDFKESGGILINNAQLPVEGKLVEFPPLNYTQGMNLPVDALGTSLSLIGEIDYVPRSIGPIYINSYLNVIVTEETFDSMVSENENYESVNILFNHDNPEGQARRLEEGLADGLPGIHYQVIDFEQQAQMMKNTTLLVMLFIYAFIGVLSLIAITNVIGTISTSISLRRREFAMLSSVGMTAKELRKMLYLESFFYGTKALAIGISLGILASLGMYFSLGIGLSFPYIFPWEGILISIAAIFLIVLLTTRYSLRSLRKENIIDSLKTDTL